ncbi:MAG: hypothetical protein HGA21_16300 [Burkholderiaceae bacterium]|jgi:hypothetical protein|nr:hypothetical protein [Burkholderiaceae bacterium]
MKRKVMMMGLAVMAGVPHGAWAKGLGKESAVEAYSAWNTAYTPHYGTEGAAHPLLDHLSAPVAVPGRDSSNEWRLKFVPPPAVSSSDDPLTANDKRVGISFSLNF